MQISDLVFSGPDDQYFATSSADGVLHLWSKDSLEHLQFQVLEQVITKKLFDAYPFHSHHVCQNRTTFIGNTFTWYDLSSSIKFTEFKGLLTNYVCFLSDL